MSFTIPAFRTHFLRSSTSRNRFIMNASIHATTIICVRKKNNVAIGSDGQVTLGDTVIKHGAKKIRRLYNEKILAGFAGSSADSFALFARFEAKLEQYHGNL